MNLLCLLQLAIFNSMAPALRLVIKFTSVSWFLRKQNTQHIPLPSQRTPSHLCPAWRTTDAAMGGFSSPLDAPYHTKSHTPGVVDDRMISCIMCLQKFLSTSFLSLLSSSSFFSFSFFLKNWIKKFSFLNLYFLYFFCFSILFWFSPCFHLVDHVLM